MSLSPLPFLRVGFMILGAGVGLAIWLGQGVPAWLAGALAILAFLAVTGIGEAIIRRIATPAALGADLAERSRHGG